MSVDGVAWATIISQYLSAVMVTICLLRSEDCIRLTLRRIRIHWARLKEIVRVGLPAGFQGALFALSNVLIQSSLNTFGSAAAGGQLGGGQYRGLYLRHDERHASGGHHLLRPEHGREELQAHSAYPARLPAADLRHLRHWLRGGDPVLRAAAAHLQQRPHGAGSSAGASRSS